MSQKLMNQTKNFLILSELDIAQNFSSRAIGLLGKKNLSAETGLWIKKCNSIHTFFMKFAIDCIFVDQSLKVKALYKNIKPWKLIWPIWSANSVFEVSVGTIERMNIEIGDQLHVVS